jgi:nitroreductase
MNKEMKEFYSILEKRFSVRQYLKDPVPRNVIDRILKVGNEAASAANKQPWAFILCQGEDKKKINDVFYRDGFKDAPVAIVAVADLQNAWTRRNDGKNYAYVDTTIAVTEMILAATAEGLGTCWIAAFDYEKAKEILDIPEGMEIVTLFTIGYIPEDIKQQERNRKPMENILHIGKYSKKKL